MGKHGKKRRFGFAGWLASGMIIGGTLGGVALAEAPSAPVSHRVPLPVFTTEPSFPSPVQPAPSAPALVSYTVQSGDTLTAIALEKCHDVNDWLALQKANRIGNPGAITIGEKISLAC